MEFKVLLWNPVPKACCVAVLKKKKNNPSSIMVKDPQTETHVDEGHASDQPTLVWWGAGAGAEEKEEINGLHD